MGQYADNSLDAGEEQETAQDLAAKEGEWAVLEVLLAHSSLGAAAKEAAWSRTAAPCIREAAALVWLASKGTRGEEERDARQAAL